MHIHIAKVNGILYEGEAESLTAPGVMGELTVLAHHVSLATALKAGHLTVRTKNEVVFTHDIDSGILEVSPHGVTVLL